MTIGRNRIRIRCAEPPPPTPPAPRHAITMPIPGHSLGRHCNSQGSELNTPADQPKQQPFPPSNTSNSGPNLDTSSLPQPQEPNSPDTIQNLLSTTTNPITNQDQPKDDPPEVRTRTILIKLRTRFKDYEF